MVANIDEVAQAIGADKREDGSMRTWFGTVASISPFKVTPDGSNTGVNCTCLFGANVGDRVLCVNDGNKIYSLGTVNGMLKASKGGSYIKSRENVAVSGESHGQSSGSSFNAVAGQKTNNGYWAIGSLSGNESLYFCYTTDDNYSSATNTSKNVYIKPENGTILPWQMIYPVGAVYLSFNSTSPASLFGGSWTQITGKFLRANNDVSTGGADTHTLTTAQMPSHNHKHREWLDNGASASGVHYGMAYYRNTGAVQDTNSYSSSGETLFGNFPTGGGGSHNNMPAYQDVYVWRRTA